MRPKTQGLAIVFATFALLAGALCSPPCAAQTSCSNYSCPTGCLGACEDCGYCNSGSFVVTCTCCPDPGYTVGDVSNGSCLQNTCNQCCSTGAFGDHCQFNGCTGQSCPSNFGPQLSAMSSVISPATVSKDGNPDPPCADPPPAASGYSCEDCVSRTINLGPGGREAKAELLIPRNIPLDYSALQLNLQENGGVSGGSYILKNNARAGLVTLITSWKFEGGPSGPSPVTSTDLIDSWATDTAFLAPGTEKKEVLSFNVLAPKGQAVRRITGTVVYAEFDNGTRFGPGVDTIYPNLHSQRQEILNDYAQLIGKIEAGLSDDELNQYVQSIRGIKWLIFVRDKGGWDAVAARISKPRRLKP